MKKSLDWAARKIRELTAQVPPPNTQNTGSGDPPPPAPRTKADQELDRRLKVLEDQKVKYAEKRKKDSLRDAAKAEGVDTNRVEGVVRYLLPDYEKRLRYDEDSDAVNYLDELDQPRPVSELIKGFLKKPEGQFYLPPPDTTSLPTGGKPPQSPGQKKYTDIPAEERQKLSIEQRLALVKADIASGQ